VGVGVVALDCVEVGEGVKEGEGVPPTVRVERGGVEVGESVSVSEGRAVVVETTTRTMPANPNPGPPAVEVGFMSSGVGVVERVGRRGEGEEEEEGEGVNVGRRGVGVESLGEPEGLSVKAFTLGVVEGDSVSTPGVAVRLERKLPLPLSVQVA